MLLSLVYLVLRRLLHVLAPSDRSDLERDRARLCLRSVRADDGRPVIVHAMKARSKFMR